MFICDILFWINVKINLEQPYTLSSKFNPLRHKINLDNIITFYVTVNGICLDHKKTVSLSKSNTHFSSEG